MKTLVLFDVDGTLTESRLGMTGEMYGKMCLLHENGFHVGIVGGSDLKKQEEQMGECCYTEYEWFFPENGLHAFKDGVEFHRRSIIDELGEDAVQIIINGCLHFISFETLPKKRGNFVELRNGMINVSPVGRSCSQEERIEFYEYDKEHKVREQMIVFLKKTMAFYNLEFAIGGQISIDIYPKGWDKTYCLRHIEEEGYERVLFVGDKTEEGGNDHALFCHQDVVGIKTTGPEHTMQIIDRIIGFTTNKGEGNGSS
jgi:phosphomannomutase